DGKPLTSFFHVQVYGKQAEMMAQSLSKGSPILIKGEMIQRSYTNSQGQR
ncbi:single-stranded DNA-binding protein, partial [Streptococcus canis]